MKSLVSLCVLAFSTGSTFAASFDTVVSGAASLSNLTYRLVDLDPLDGIAPSISFYSKIATAGDASLGDGSSYNSKDLKVNGLFLSDSTTFQSLNGNAQSSVSGATNVTASAKLTLDQTQAFINGAYLNDPALAQNSSVERFGQTPYTWQLSPHTQLIIEGSSSNNLNSDISKITVDPSVFRYAGATQYTISGGASAGVQLSFTGLSDYNSDVYSTYYNNNSVSYVFTKEGMTQSLATRDISETFQVSVKNNTSSSRNGVILYSVATNLSTTLSFVPTIPEPNTWALFGLGFLGIGLRASRMKRH